MPNKSIHFTKDRLEWLDKTAARKGRSRGNVVAIALDLLREVVENSEKGDKTVIWPNQKI